MKDAQIVKLMKKGRFVCYYVKGTSNNIEQIKSKLTIAGIYNEISPEGIPFSNDGRTFDGDTKVIFINPSITLPQIENALQ